MEAASSLIELLIERGMTIAAAESLTGGLISAGLVDVPGASAAFMEGFITYDTAAKERTLKVPHEIIAEEGAVSARCASCMARGAARAAGTDMAIASTGNAGPDSSEGKPVGLVYTATYLRGETEVLERKLSGSRNEIREETARLAIEAALRLLSEYTETK